MSFFQLFQPSLEIAGLDRPDKDLDHPRQLRRLAGGDRARSGRIGDRRHRAAEIGGAVHRHQAQLHRPPAARRNDAVEAQPSAIPSPARASSTALRVSASASPSSSSSAVCVALLRAPAGRPFGLPDRPFRNRPSGSPDRPVRNRPRASRSSCFCNESTSTPFSFAITAPLPERCCALQNTV